MASTEYAFTLQPLNDSARKNWWGKTYFAQWHAKNAQLWFCRNVPDAQFAVRRCIVTADDSGCEVVQMVGPSL